MGFSIWQLLIVLAIVMLLFGTKKIASIGSDLGGAIKNFRKSVKDGEEEKPEEDKSVVTHQDSEGRVIEGQVAAKDVAAKDKDKTS